MRLILLAGLSLAVAACGGERTDANEAADANVLEVENVTIVENGMTMNGAAGLDGNATTTSDTDNMLMNDLTSNDADTNLANGL